jgi:hypothetical protein
MTTQNTAPTFTVGDGIVTTPNNVASSLDGYSVVAQADGKILVSGSYGFIVARYNSNAMFDF